MLKLRKFLCTCFAQVALLFLIVSVGTTPRIFTLGSGQETGPFQASPSADFFLQIAAPLLLSLAHLILALPLLMTALYGMAWWTVKTGKSSGRRWAIAASIAMILQGIPQLALTLYFWNKASGLALEGMIALDLITLGIGIPGLIAFWPKDAVAPVVIAPRIAGDGTSRVLDAVAWLAQAAGYFYGMHLWDRWGRTQQLAALHGFSFWLLFAAVILVAIFVHELGHAVVGRALGMRLHSFLVGPFTWRVDRGRWKFQFVPALILSARGGAGVVPSTPSQGRWDEICMIAAGPAVNLLIGTLAMCAALTASGQPWEPYWYTLATFATLSFVLFAGNLIPFRPEASYSDGARIYQLLRGGPLVDLHRALGLASATRVTAIRPRDYDIAAIQRAADTFNQGQRAFLLRTMAAEHFLDSGAIPQFFEALTKAESVYPVSPSDAPASWLTIFVVGHALVRGDSADGRMWWDRMEAGKPDEATVDYWLARSAVMWVEGRSQEAQDAWSKADGLTTKPVKCGSDEYENHLLALVRRALNAPALAEEQAS
jgi:Zn-dependent protease